MRNWLSAVDVDEGRGQVHRLDQGVAARAPRGVGAVVGVVDDQGRADDGLVEQVFFSHPVVAQVVPVIAGEDDHGGVHEALRFKKGEQDAQLVVDLLDQAHVSGHHRIPDAVPRERARDAVVHHGRVDGMGILAFRVRTDHRQGVFRPVHAGVGLGDDVGPMWLDVGKVQAPRLVAGVADEIHGAARDVGGLGMLVRHARGPIRIFEEPAGTYRAVVFDGGVCPGFPRVIAIETLLAQVGVIGGVGIMAGVGVDAVVALVGIEAAFGDTHSDLRGRVDTQPRHTGKVGAHMGFPDQDRTHAQRPQMVADRHLPGLERHEVPACPVRVHVAAGVVAHARWAADGGLDIGPVEDHAARGQAVDIRGLERRMSETGQMIGA
ncbi:hypothetical protein D9M68_618290 [compost metagenome]